MKVKWKQVETVVLGR